MTGRAWPARLAPVRIAFGLLAAAVGAQQPPPAPPTDPAAPTPPPPPPAMSAYDLAAAMTQSMRLATPGPQHARLAALAGRFEVAMTLLSPGMPALECAGKAVAASVLGGRYLILDCTVDVKGSRLEGIYVFGYDNLHELYTASWRDSMSTWPVESSGSADPAAADRIQLAGTLVDAASPTGRPFRMDLQFVGDGCTIEVFDTVAGAQQLVMRQQFRRAPADPATPRGK